MNRNTTLLILAVLGIGLFAGLAYTIHQRETYIALAIGLILTAIVSAFWAIRRAQAIEREFQARSRELRKANDQVGQQRNILQSVLDHLGDGVAVADANGKLTLFNPAAERILGLGKTDTGPGEWSRVYGLYHPDMRTPIPSAELPLARAIAGETSRDVEIFVRNPERQQGLFIRVTASPLTNREGVSEGGVAVFRDVSERKWTEAVLRDSEARFRAIVEATASALIILSTDYRIREFNPQAERAFGVSRAVALGQDFLTLCLPEEYRRPVADDIKQVLAGEMTPGFEIPVQLGKSAERTLLWSFSRLFESEARETVVIATGHDITERRQAEAARRVRELAAHLQSAREAERTHIAREIHDELGQALIGLKLEISYVSRRARSDSPEVATKLAEVGTMIDSTIASMRRLAADLRPQVLDELGLLEAIRWQVKEFQQRTGITCDLELPDDEPGWSDDRATAMFRIVQESLTNIARHADATAVTVRVLCEVDRVVLEVADDGRGITKDQAEHSKSFGVLGMRERARMFGGALRVQRGDPRGTTVRVSMPY